MDAVLLLLIYVGFFTGVFGVFGGRMLDPKWRAMQMRRFLRKNYVQVCMVEKDGKKILDKIVDGNKGIIQIAGQIWIMAGDRIYRRNKPEDGFSITDKNRKWEEGLPTIFLNRDTVKPLDFFETKSNVNAEELSANLNSYIENERAKMLLSIKAFKTLLIVAVIASMLAVAISAGTFMAESDNTKILKTNTASIDYIRGYLNIPLPNATNGTITPVIVK